MTVKTILFASLIVAMILPFSSMNYAVADEQTKIDQEKLKEYRNGLEAKLKETIDKEERKELKVVIKRIKLMEKLLDHKQNPTNNAEVDNATTTSLLEEIKATFDKDVENSFTQQSTSSEALSTQAFSTQSTTVNWQTSTQTKWNCYYNSNPTGFNWGTWTGLDFIESYFVSVQGYPSSIAVLEGTSCEVKDFSSGYSNARNLSNGKLCATSYSNANESVSGYCWNFGVGAPVLITANAWYEDLNVFSVTEGWYLFWIPS